MGNLAEVLVYSGIDVSTLEPLFKRGRYTIFALKVRGNLAVDLWDNLRRLVLYTRCWPVILGDQEDWDFYQKMQLSGNRPRSVQKILKASNEVDPQKLLKDFWDAEWGELTPEEYQESMKSYHGEWPQGDQASHSFSTPFDILTRKPKPSVYIAFFPTICSWEIPAWLNFGDWNACPRPEFHVALQKYWHYEYGTELVCVTEEIIEVHVPHPPKTKKEALALAEEQYLYCGDIVWQGTDTIEGLASTLLGGTSWYFWWD